MKKLLSGIVVFSIAVLVGCASAPTPPAVGVWSAEMNTPLGTLPVTLTINADGTGLMVADNLGETEIAGIAFDGNMVMFETEVDAQGQTLVLDFSGSVDGDSVTGEFDSDFGAFGVTGTRQ